jgi:hypothetical protein
MKCNPAYRGQAAYGKTKVAERQASRRAPPVPASSATAAGRCASTSPWSSVPHPPQRQSGPALHRRSTADPAARRPEVLIGGDTNKITIRHSIRTPNGGPTEVTHCVGAVTSPLLANIALSGLDRQYQTDWRDMSSHDGKRQDLRRKGLATYRLIRSADDRVPRTLKEESM